MGNLIKRIRIASFIIILLQIAFIAVFAILYFNNILKIKDYVQEVYVVLGALIIVGFDSLFIWIETLRISRIRQKTDLHAAEVIGSDIQEAYNFAMLGLAVTDDDDIIMWTNDLFKDRNRNEYKN